MSMKRLQLEDYHEPSMSTVMELDLNSSTKPNWASIAFKSMLVLIYTLLWSKAREGIQWEIIDLTTT